jgi:hypothetical protein
LQRAEVRACKAVLEYALSRFGRDFFLAAWADFFLGEPRGRKPLDQIPEFETMFVPWFVVEFVRDPYGDLFDGAWPADPVAADWLSSPGSADQLEREWASAAVRSPIALFEVGDVQADRGAALLDLLTRRRFFVREPALKPPAASGDFLVSRVVTVRGVSRLLGAAPVVFSGADRRRVLCQRNRNVAFRVRSRKELAAYHYEIRTMYFELTDPNEPMPADCDAEDENDDDVELLPERVLTPEEEARLSGGIASRLADWVDQPIMVLGGRTALEASRLPEFRPRLRAMVDSLFENSISSIPGWAEGIDDLKRRLGLN